MRKTFWTGFVVGMGGGRELAPLARAWGIILGFGVGVLFSWHCGGSWSSP